MKSMPTHMRVVEITRHGGPEVLAVTTRPVPSPAGTEVLVRVHAAGVNRPDVSQRIGIYDPPPGASDLPGLEIAGVVTQAGPSVMRWQPGDAVCALVAGGGYAEFCVVEQAHCMPLPRGFDFVQAAAIPETFFTAWVNLFEPDIGRLANAENLLVQGGTSGVGIAAIQLARELRGASIIATASSDVKRQLCLELGCRAAIDYRDADWPGLAKAATGGEGFDMILDAQAGSYTQAELDLLREGGRLVLLGTHRGTHAQINLRDLMRRRLTLTGSTLRPRSSAFKARIARTMEASVWPLLEASKLRVVIDRVFPLDQAVAAHQLLERGDQMGKVMLTVAAS
jgi:NADPH2:quinone reductase